MTDDPKPKRKIVRVKPGRVKRGGAIQSSRYWTTIRWVLENSEASTEEYLVLQAIANHADEGGYCFLSQTTIHAESHIPSVNTANACVPVLEEMGELVVARHATRGGSGNVNHFVVVMGTVGEDGRRVSPADDWLRAAEYLREKVAANPRTRGKEMTFSTAPTHLREDVDEILSEQISGPSNTPSDGVLQRAVDVPTTHRRRSEKPRESRADTNTPSNGVFDQKTARVPARLLAKNRADYDQNRAENRASTRARTTSELVNRTTPPPVSDVVDVRDATLAEEQQKTRFQKLRGALIGRDGRDDAHLSGNTRDRVWAIAAEVDDDGMEALISELWNVAPLGHQVPWLVDWCEDRVNAEPRSQAETQAEIAVELEARKTRLSVIEAELGGGNPIYDDPDLTREAADVRAEIELLRAQLAGESAAAS